MNADPILLDAQRKRESTLQALLALRGVEMQRMADGSFIVSRWGLLQPLADFDAVESFLAEIGGEGT